MATGSLPPALPSEGSLAWVFFLCSQQSGFSITNPFRNFLFMDSDASFLLSPCVLLSEGAALTMAPPGMPAWQGTRSTAGFPFWLIRLVSHTRAY